VAGSGLTSEQRREIYPNLQKRLDDSNDEIRIRAASCCRAFFTSLAPEGYDDANSEYFTTAVVVHMDDADPRVQVSCDGPDTKTTPLQWSLDPYARAVSSLYALCLPKRSGTLRSTLHAHWCCLDVPGDLGPGASSQLPTKQE
jgi:hypothetical protein